MTEVTALSCIYVQFCIECWIYICVTLLYELGGGEEYDSVDSHFRVQYNKKKRSALSLN
jgi:hypothetical protein